MDTQGGDYAEGTVDKRVGIHGGTVNGSALGSNRGTATFHHGDISAGPISGSTGVVIGHGSVQHINQAATVDWQQALTELHHAIAALPAGERRQAQASANDLEDEVAKAQPDKTRVQQLLATLRTWGGVVAEAAVNAAMSEVVQRLLR
ncbi:MAG: hypothetical protein M3R24_37455 [Chloroflexota bacterium]|nr:hypothetical protein [Chloroflexota bacterium]